MAEPTQRLWDASDNDWASSAAPGDTLSTPTDGERVSGHVQNTGYTSGRANYLWNTASQWIRHLRDTRLQVFSTLEELVAGLATGKAGLVAPTSFGRFTVTSWTQSEANNDDCLRIISDGQYVYRVWYDDSAGTYQLKATQRDNTSLWTAVPTTRALGADGNYVFFQDATNYKKVGRVDGASMASLASAGIGNSRNLVATGSSLYAVAAAGGFSDGSSIKRLAYDLSAVSASFTHGADLYDCCASRSGLVYVCGDTGTSSYQARILSSSSLTNLVGAVSLGASGVLRAICTDGDFVFLGGDAFGGVEVRCVTADNLAVDVWTYAYGSTVRSLAVDHKYTYVGGATSIHILDKRSGARVATYGVGSGVTIEALDSDGESLFMGLGASASTTAVARRVRGDLRPTIWTRAAGDDDDRYPFFKLALPS